MQRSLPGAGTREGEGSVPQKWTAEVRWGLRYGGGHFRWREHLQQRYRAGECLPGRWGCRRTSCGRVLGGPGPGHSWKTEGCSDGGALHGKSDRNWNGSGCLGRWSWVTLAFPSWGRVTLGKSFPVPQPWLSPVGWHNGAASFNVADAPHMLSLVPGTWGHPDDTLLDIVVFNASVGALGLCRPYPVL